MAHFYTKTGESMHEVLGANGKLKPTTIREARLLGLVPSVTTVMEVQSKPALLIWMQQQILQTTIECPFHPDEWDEKAWRAAIMQRTRLRTEVAATRGTELHDKLEQWYAHGIMCPKDEAYITPAINLIDKEFSGVKWVAEESFVSDKGYAGRVDMYSKEGIVLDFKTKDKTNPKDMVQYDDHKVQLAAYQEGLKLPSNSRRFNLFISTNSETPGLCRLVECNKFDKFLDIFYSLHKLWCLKNNYIPGGCDV